MLLYSIFQSLVIRIIASIAFIHSKALMHIYIHATQVSTFTGTLLVLQEGWKGLKNPEIIGKIYCRNFPIDGDPRRIKAGMLEQWGGKGIMEKMLVRQISLVDWVNQELLLWVVHDGFVVFLVCLIGYLL